VLPTPAFAMRLAFGEMAEELLLAGARVVPGRLNERGFVWRSPELEGALHLELG
jgi:NAD dependent epimerase/dehydratase family enzyme